MKSEKKFAIYNKVLKCYRGKAPGMGVADPSEAAVWDDIQDVFAQIQLAAESDNLCPASIITTISHEVEIMDVDMEFVSLIQKLSKEEVKLLQKHGLAIEGTHPDSTMVRVRDFRIDAGRMLVILRNLEYDDRVPMKEFASFIKGNSEFAEYIANLDMELDCDGDVRIYYGADAGDWNFYDCPRSIDNVRDMVDWLVDEFDD